MKHPKPAILFDCFGVIYDERSGINQELVALIEELSPQYRLGILSNTTRETLKTILSSSHIGKVFEVMVASADTPYVKPEKGIFEVAATEFGLPLTELLFIDDIDRNVSAADLYGLRSHLYTSVPELRQWLKASLVY
jgi:HAD superfamily hydrolase (TIGR01509 family)